MPAPRPSSAAETTPVRPLSEFSLPPETAVLEETFKGNGDAAVFLIQDAHAVPEAQKKIRSTLENLNSRFGVKVAGIEGAASKLDAGLMRSFPEPEILAQVFQEYMEAQELTGANAAALFGPGGMEFYGIEDWPLFEEGAGAFIQSALSEKETGVYLENKMRHLDLEKKEIYSPALYELDRLIGRFYRDGENLGTLLEAAAAVLEPEPGSGLKLLSDESARPEAAQAKQILEKAAARLSLAAGRENGREDKILQAELNEKIQAFRTSAISVLEFAHSLEELAGRFTSMYPGLLKEGSVLPPEAVSLARRQAKLSAIDGTLFYEELEDYLRQVKEKLFSGEAAENLDNEGRRIHLLERLSKAGLTWKEYSELSKVSLTEEEKQLFREPLRFYAAAEARDRALYINARKLLDSPGAETGSGARAIAIVAGGFHTQGLKELLKRGGVSYYVLRPAIGGLPGESRYKEQMLGNVSWKDYFETGGQTIDLNRAFLRAARDRLLEEAEKRGLETGKLLKVWRDSIIRMLAERDDLDRAFEYMPYIDELAGEKKDGLRDWEANLEKFIQGLRSLDSTGTLNQQNVGRIFQQMKSVPAATANAFAVRGKIRTELVLGVRPRRALARSELRSLEDYQKPGRLASEGRAAIDRGDYPLARQLFLDAARAFISFEKEFFAQGDWRRLLNSVVFEEWAEQTQTKQVFNWHELRDADHYIQSERKFEQVLSASLLLASDYLRKRGPDITDVSAKVYGKFPDGEPLKEADIVILERLKGPGGAPTSSLTYRASHARTGEELIVKVLEHRAVTEMLGRWWFERLGFSTVDMEPLTIGGRPAVVMKKIPGVVTAFEYVISTVAEPLLFDDELLLDRLFPESYKRLFEKSKLADVTIELKDAHLSNILLHVDAGGELLPEPPVFIDKERAFGFHSEGRERLFYKPYRGAFAADILSSGMETNELNAEPAYHRDLPLERMSAAARAIAGVEDAEIRAAAEASFSAFPRLDANRFPAFDPKTLAGQWIAAVNSVRTIFSLPSPSRGPEPRSELRASEPNPEAQALIDDWNSIQKEHGNRLFEAVSPTQARSLYDHRLTRILDDTYPAEQHQSEPEYFDFLMYAMLHPDFKVRRQAVNRFLFSAPHGVQVNVDYLLMHFVQPWISLEMYGPHADVEGISFKEDDAIRLKRIALLSLFANLGEEKKVAERWRVNAPYALYFRNRLREILEEDAENALADGAASEDLVRYFARVHGEKVLAEKREMGLLEGMLFELMRYEYKVNRFWNTDKLGWLHRDIDDLLSRIGAERAANLRQTLKEYPFWTPWHPENKYPEVKLLDSEALKDHPPLQRALSDPLFLSGTIYNLARHLIGPETTGIRVKKAVKLLSGRVEITVENTGGVEAVFILLQGEKETAENYIEADRLAAGGKTPAIFPLFGALFETGSNEAVWSLESVKAPYYPNYQYYVESLLYLGMQGYKAEGVSYRGGLTVRAMGEEETVPVFINLDRLTAREWNEEFQRELLREIIHEAGMSAGIDDFLSVFRAARKYLPLELIESVYREWIDTAPLALVDDSPPEEEVLAALYGEAGRPAAAETPAMPEEADGNASDDLARSELRTDTGEKPLISIDRESEELLRTIEHADNTGLFEALERLERNYLAYRDVYLRKISESIERKFRGLDAPAEYAGLKRRLIEMQGLIKAALPPENERELFPDYPADEAPRTAVIIPIYADHSDTAREKKKSLIENLLTLRTLDYPREKISVIIVDNGSSDKDTVFEIKDRFPQVTVLLNSKNQGFSGGVNRGIEYARQKGIERFWVLNDDTYVQDPRILTKFLRITEDESVGFAGVRNVNYDKAAGRWEIAQNYPTPPMSSSAHERTARYREVDFAIGSSFFVTERVLQRIGLMDERYFLYFEETDWNARAWNAGLKNVQIEAARMVHKEAGGGIFNENSAYYFTRNAFLYAKKHLRGFERLFAVRTFFDYLRNAYRIRRTMRDFYGNVAWAAFKGFIAGLLNNYSAVPETTVSELKGFEFPVSFSEDPDPDTRHMVAEWNVLQAEHDAELFIPAGPTKAKPGYKHRLTDFLAEDYDMTPHRADRTYHDFLMFIMLNPNFLIRREATNHLLMSGSGNIYVSASYLYEHFKRPWVSMEMYGPPVAGEGKAVNPALSIRGKRLAILSAIGVIGSVRNRVDWNTDQGYVFSFRKELLAILQKEINELMSGGAPALDRLRELAEKRGDAVLSEEREMPLIEGILLEILRYEQKKQSSGAPDPFGWLNSLLLSALYQSGAANSLFLYSTVTAYPWRQPWTRNLKYPEYELNAELPFDENSSLGRAFRNPVFFSATIYTLLPDFPREVPITEVKVTPRYSADPAVKVAYLAEIKNADGQTGKFVVHEGRRTLLEKYFKASVGAEAPANKSIKFPRFGSEFVMDDVSAVWSVEHVETQYDYDLNYLVDTIFSRAREKQAFSTGPFPEDVAVVENRRGEPVSVFTNLDHLITFNLEGKNGSVLTQHLLDTYGHQGPKAVLEILSIAKRYISKRAALRGYSNWLKEQKPPKERRPHLLEVYRTLWFQKPLVPEAPKRLQELETDARSELRSWGGDEEDWIDAEAANQGRQQRQEPPEPESEYVPPVIGDQSSSEHPLDLGRKGDEPLSKEELRFVRDTLRWIKGRAVKLGDTEMLELIASFDTEKQLRKGSFKTIKALGAASIEDGTVSLASEFLRDAMDRANPDRQEIVQQFRKTMVHELQHIADAAHPGRKKWFEAGSFDTAKAEASAIIMSAAYFDGYIAFRAYPPGFSAVSNYRLKGGKKTDAETAAGYGMEAKEPYGRAVYGKGFAAYKQKMEVLKRVEADAKPVDYYRAAVDYVTSLRRSELRAGEEEARKKAAEVLFAGIEKRRPWIAADYRRLPELSARERKELEDEIYELTAGQLILWGAEQGLEQVLSPFENNHVSALAAVFPGLNLDPLGFQLAWKAEKVPGDDEGLQAARDKEAGLKSVRFVLGREIPGIMRLYEKFLNRKLSAAKVHGLKRMIYDIQKGDFEGWKLSSAMDKRHAPYFGGSYISVLTEVFSGLGLNPLAFQPDWENRPVESLRAALEREVPAIVEQYRRRNSLSRVARENLLADIYAINSLDFGAWELSYVLAQENGEGEQKKKKVPFKNYKDALMQAFDGLGLVEEEFGMDMSTPSKALNAVKYQLNKNMPTIMERYARIESLSTGDIINLRINLYDIKMGHFIIWGIKNATKHWNNSHIDTLAVIFDHPRLKFSAEEMRNWRRSIQPRYSWGVSPAQDLQNVLDGIRRHEPDLLSEHERYPSMNFEEKKAFRRRVVSLSAGNFHLWEVSDAMKGRSAEAAGLDSSGPIDIIVSIFHNLRLTRKDFELDWSSPEASAESIRYVFNKRMPELMELYSRYAQLDDDEKEILKHEIYRINHKRFVAMGLSNTFKQPQYESRHVWVLTELFWDIPDLDPDNFSMEWRDADPARARTKGVTSVKARVRQYLPKLMAQYEALKDGDEAAAAELRRRIYKIRSLHFNMWRLKQAKDKTVAPYFEGSYIKALQLVFNRLNLSPLGFGPDWSTPESTVESIRFIIREEMPELMEAYDRAEALDEAGLENLRKMIYGLRTLHLRAWGIYTALANGKAGAHFGKDYRKALAAVFDHPRLGIRFEAFNGHVRHAKKESDAGETETRSELRLDVSPARILETMKPADERPRHPEEIDAVSEYVVAAVRRGGLNAFVEALEKEFSKTVLRPAAGASGAWKSAYEAAKSDLLKAISQISMSGEEKILLALDIAGGGLQAEHAGNAVKEFGPFIARAVFTGEGRKNQALMDALKSEGIQVTAMESPSKALEKESRQRLMPLVQSGVSAAVPGADVLAFGVDTSGLETAGEAEKYYAGLYASLTSSGLAAASALSGETAEKMAARLTNRDFSGLSEDVVRLLQALLLDDGSGLTGSVISLDGNKVLVSAAAMRVYLEYRSELRIAQSA